jgi:hypothetical protein
MMTHLKDEFVDGTDRLEAWADRGATATSLDDIFEP